MELIDVERTNSDILPCGAQTKEVTISTEFSSDEAAVRLWNIRIVGD